MTGKSDRDRLDRFIRRFWVAFGIMILGIGFAGWGWVERTNGQLEDAQRVTNDRLELAQRGICKRLQIVRMNTNRNSFVIHEAVDATVRDTRVASTRRELLRLREVPRYQPRVDCDEVIERPTSYEPPRPIPVQDMTPVQRSAILENGSPPPPPSP